ncbi:MAG TPA: hypothetical protein PKJ24_01105, partial [Prolixibacteraceae bacterium]|nr:hypothetical protein [Prolixibacteraceae bacterium]
MYTFHHKVFFVFFLTLLLPSPPGFSSQKQPTSGQTEEWVVYSTEIGWLRVGTWTEYKSIWLKKDEIWGGNSQDTLKKRLLLHGFSSREEAVEELCSKLTKVQLRIEPPLRGAPVRYIKAVLDTAAYFLRLSKGFSAEEVEIMSKGGNFRGLEYDFESEYKLLADNGITPRYIFPGKQWLIHATGRGTYNGPQQLDTWMCFTRSPDKNGTFTIPLADGTTQTYSSDRHEGPFMDNFTMAEVMKRYGILSVDLWPPVTSYYGFDVQPRVEVARIPQNPKDYGKDVLPQQPILPDSTLRDWVIYEVEGGWLHVGTRREFKSTLLKREVIWGGTAEDPVNKTIIDPQGDEKYFSFDEAVSTLCANLSGVTAEFHPLADPRETINGLYKGKAYKIRIDRGQNGGSLPVFVYSNYNYSEIWNRLAEHGITPRRKFAESKLVHITGYGTYSGPQKADRWMLVGANAVNPDGKGMVLADGMGGTMGYSIDFASQVVSSNYELSPLLRQLIGSNENLRSLLGSVGTGSLNYGIRFDEVPDNPKDHGDTPGISKISVREIIPNHARQGDTLGVAILAKGLDNGCQLSFGSNIGISNLVYGGSSALAGYDLWYCTLKIKDVAETGLRTIVTGNRDGGQSTLPEGFEVKEKTITLCPFVQLVAPVSSEYSSLAADCNRYKADQEAAIQKIKSLASQTTGLPAGNRQEEKKREINRKLADARIEMETAEDFYWENMGHLIGDLSEEQIGTLSGSLKKRCTCLLEKSQAQLDILRETTFSFFENSTWSDSEAAYRDTYRALDHTLKLWRSFATMLQERREYEIQMARRKKTLGEESNLPQAMRKLFEAVLMKGDASVIREQLMAEYGLQMKDSHGASLREAAQKREMIRISDDRGTALYQWFCIGGRYFVGVNQTMFSGAFGLLQTTWNMLFGDWYETESASVQIRRQIADSRKRFNLKQEQLMTLHHMSDVAITSLGYRTGDSGSETLDGNMRLLEDDRVWIEDTDGGILRLSACFDPTWQKSKESEYLIMLRRGELSLRDMKETLNIKMGADPKSGEFSRLKMLFDPMKIVSNYFAESEKAEFSSRVSFLADRESELKMASQMLPAFRKIGFDLVRLSWYPRLMTNHYSLRSKNPDYLRWTIAMTAIDAKEREDQLESALLKSETNSQAHELKRKRLENRRNAMVRIGKDWARWCKLDGIDRLMLWDWQGALMSFTQASASNPAIVSPEALNNLKKELEWQVATEMALESFEFLGNQGVYSMVFGLAGKLGGEALHKAGFNWWGLASVDDMAIAAQEAQGFWGRTMKYWAGFADFTFGQINPFWNMASASGSWKEIREKYLQTFEEISEEVISPEISRKILVGFFGMDQEYADFIAEALVESYGGVKATNQTIALQDALRLKNNGSKWQQLAVMHRLYLERSDSRSDLTREIKTIEALMKAEKAREELELMLAREALADWDFNRLKPKTEAIQQAETQLNNQVEPMTNERMENALNDLKDQLAQATTPEERKVLLARYFAETPFLSQRELFRKNVQDPLSVRSDQYRRELLDIVRHLFLKRFAEKYSDWFIGFTLYGSAAHPEWAAYKRLWSDLDITALLKASTPKEIREQFKADFDLFFLENAKMPPEALDIHMFADTRPVFRSRIPAPVFLEGTALARALAENPALAARIYGESTESLQLLWQNMVDPERYLLPGNLFIFNYLVKMVGIMQSGELVKEGEHYQLKTDASGFNEIYESLQFDAWMGMDILLDHLMHISHARKSNETDMYAYSKDLAKYSIRILLGRIIQTREGLNILNSATSDQVAQAGGLEAYIVQVAKDLVARNGTDYLWLTPDQLLLLDEWIMRKEAKPFGEIFQKRAKAGSPLTENDSRMDQYMADHINQTEAFLMETIKVTITSQAAFLVQLMTAAETEQNPVVKRALEAKFRQILCSQAALWKRLRPEERKQVQVMAPVNSPFWRIIEMYNEIGNRADAQKGDPNTFYINTYWPVHHPDDR